MWHCTKCGTEHKSQFAFCWNCGTQRASSITAQVVDAIDPTSGHLPVSVDKVMVETENLTRAYAPPDYRGQPPRKRSSLSSHPDFPLAPPSILLWPENRIRRVCGLTGLVLGLGIALAAVALFERSSMIGRMFDPRSVVTLIPITILILFFWGVALCLFRFLRLSALERVSRISLLIEAASSVESDGLTPVMEDLSQPSVQASPLLRRIKGVIRQWDNRPGILGADVILQQHDASDNGFTQAGYSLIRTFVWALPVLGLIGTVIGISLAVGGFAHFLGGDIEDVAVIKRNLVGVTGGLSFAFLITLQGLFTSLLLMFAAAALQTREERLYSLLQREVASVLLPALQQAMAEGGQTKGSPFLQDDGLIALRDHLKAIADAVVGSVHQQSLRLIEAIESKQLDFREQVLEGTLAIKRESDAGAERLAGTFSATIAQLAKHQDAVLRQSVDIKEAIDLRTTATVEAVESFTQKVVTHQHDMARLFSEQTELLSKNDGAIVSLAASAATALDRQAILQVELRRFAESELDRRLGELVVALNAKTAEAEAVVNSYAGLSTLTKDLLTAQVTLQASIEQVQSTGLDRTLGSFRDSLEGLRPILEGFQKPFILQAVPVREALKAVNKEGNGFPKITG